MIPPSWGWCGMVADLGETGWEALGSPSYKDALDCIPRLDRPQQEGARVALLTIRPMLRFAGGVACHAVNPFRFMIIQVSEFLAQPRLGRFPRDVSSCGNYG